MPFVSRLELDEAGTSWELGRSLRYEGAVDTWTVPEHFRTDLATVPQLLSSLLLRDDVRSNKAAVLHDYLCTVGLLLGLITSIDADGVFRRTLREGGLGVVLRWLAWTGVRWGALFNPLRRPGWWRTAPAVLAISAVALVPVLALVVVAGANALLVWLLNRLLAFFGIT